MTNKKLKTLKDLENEYISISEKVRDIKYSDQPKLLKTLKHFNIMVSIPPKNLQDAAREWVKELETKPDFKPAVYQIEWIKCFFNLEETE